MSARQEALRRERFTVAHDLAIGAGIAALVGAFVFIARVRNPGSDLEAQIISAFGVCTFLLLQLILLVRPLAQLSPRFQPLLSNRRRFVVILAVVAFLHGIYATFWFHGGGVINPLLSLFISNPRFDSLSAFPFEVLGVAALAIVLLVAATAYAVEVLLYAAYALVVLHVLLGAASGNNAYIWLVAAGFVVIAAAHLLSVVARAPRSVPVPSGALWAALLTLCMLYAWLTGVLQRPSGDGMRAALPHEFVGTLSRDPYPMLRTTSDGKPTTYLLAAEGRHDADGALGPTPDGPVRISGRLIARRGVDLIELASDDVAVIAEIAPIPEPARELHGTMALDGTIVSSKCWLGGMKPCDGRIAKGSMSLDVRGGIPPLFIVRDAQAGVPATMLLTQADGSAVPTEEITPFVADTVHLVGTIEKRDDLWVFRADFATLTRVH